MNAHKAFPVILCAFVSFFLSQTALASMSSTNYRIDWDVVNAGGDSSSSSSSYILRDSIGEVGAGREASSSYVFDAGYRAGVYDRVADFTVYLQDRSSQVGATALSSSTVTVSSASGFSAGQMVAIVQNEGASQLAAVGKISSISSNDITIDNLTGDSLTIDGSNDAVYRLNGSSISLGTLSSSVVSTSIIAWEATGDTDGGFDVYVAENQNLTDGSGTVSDVSDGEVTAGSSEYGARSSDSSIASSTFDTQDTAITQTPVVVGTQTGTSFTKRDFLTLKASISGSEGGGTYSQTLTLLYVGDY